MNERIFGDEIMNDENKDCISELNEEHLDLKTNYNKINSESDNERNLLNNKENDYIGRKSLLEPQKSDIDENLYHYIFMILTFLMTYFIVRMKQFDFNPHMNWIPSVSELLHPIAYFKKNSEPLWHYLTRLINVIFNIPVKDSGAIVTGLCNVAVYEIVRNYLKKYTSKANFIAFLCLIVGPLWMPWYNKGRIYLGQGTPNVWHNPTILMVRPFAYLVVIKSMALLDNPIHFSDYRTKWKSAVSILVLILLSCLSKPCFVQVFFPAIFIYCVVLVIIKHEYFWNAFLLFLSCIPTVILLIVQIVMIFVVKGKNVEGGSIAIKFMQVMKIFSPSPILSLFLLLAFPISICIWTILSKKRADNLYLFSWLMYLCGLIEKMFLVEKKRPSHGNFGWGALVAVSILFTISIKQYIDLIRNYETEQNRQINAVCFRVSSSLLILHVIVGLVYWYRVLMLKKYF